MKKLLLFALVLAGVMTSALDACCHRVRCCNDSSVVSETPYKLVYND